MQPRQRIALLLLAAAALAALAGVDPAREAAAPGPPAPTPAEPAVPAERAGVAGIGEPGRAFQVQPLPETQDAFRPRNWQPPPAPSKPLPPVKPTAPPLPFAYLGRIEEGGATTVYLRRGEDVVLAQPRKAIDAAYRLEDVAADRLVFVYVPLQQQQILSLGGAR